jgi:two-component sensor histidine kinase
MDDRAHEEADTAFLRCDRRLLSLTSMHEECMYQDDMCVDIKDMIRRLEARTGS